jgi:hypothetical protein
VLAHILAYLPEQFLETEQSHFWDVRKSPLLDPISSQLHPVHTITHYLRSILILSSLLHLRFRSGLVLWDFQTQILYAFVIFPVRSIKLKSVWEVFSLDASRTGILTSVTPYELQNNIEQFYRWPAYPLEHFVIHSDFTIMRQRKRSINGTYP